MTTPVDPTPDALAELLRGADAAAPPPSLPADLSEKVRSLARYRRRRSRVVAGSVLGLMVMGSAEALLRFGRNDVPRNPAIARAPSPAAPVQTAPSTDPSTAGAQSDAELRHARAEAERYVASANRIVLGEHRRRQAWRLSEAMSEAAVPRPNPVAAVREQAAMALVRQGGRFMNRVNSPADALAAYRRAVELFPDTPAAAVARDRILELQSLPPAKEI